MCNLLLHPSAPLVSSSARQACGWLNPGRHGRAGLPPANLNPPRSLSQPARAGQPTTSSVCVLMSHQEWPRPLPRLHTSPGFHVELGRGMTLGVASISRGALSTIGTLDIYMRQTSRFNASAHSQAWHIFASASTAQISRFVGVRHQTRACVHMF